MKPLVVFPDAEKAALDYLKPLLSALSVSYKPVGFGNTFPTSPPASGTTFLQVELDGTPTVAYPSTEWSTVRFTVWGASKLEGGNAKKAASLVQGLIATHPGDSSVFATTILTGRLKGIDPDSGLPFVSFTARLSLRPQAL